MIKIVKTSIKLSELLEIASEEYGDMVKAVVDAEQGTAIARAMWKAMKLREK